MPHWIRRRAAASSSLEHHPDSHTAEAGVEDGLGDRLVVELLDGDVERALGAGDEVDDHLFQVVRRAQLGRPDVPLDRALREHRHGESFAQGSGIVAHRVINPSGVIQVP